MKIFAACAIVGLVALAATAVTPPAGAASPQTPPPDDAARDEYARGRVLSIERMEVKDIGGTEHFTQHVRLRLTSGADREREITADHSVPLALSRGQALRVGDAVVVARSTAAGDPAYYIVDRYRLAPLGAIAVLFVAAAVVFSGAKGAMSVVGLGVSILVLALFVVPQILAGANPLVISLLGALAIALVSIYLAHGFSRRTSVALAGTLITLGLAAGLAIAFVRLAGLSGAGSEEAFYLQLGPLETLNLRGLLLGGIILGALGVLDDITTAQAAVVDELSQANPALPPIELYRRGLSVGQEHIAALVNTLVLAYAGAALPLFLLFAVDIQQPLWVTLNSELIAEEVVRALIGSLALVLAVPITTWLAAQLLRARSQGAQ